MIWKIKQLQKFNYQSSVVMDDGKQGTEIRRYIGIVKDVSQKLKV